MIRNLAAILFLLFVGAVGSQSASTDGTFTVESGAVIEHGVSSVSGSDGETAFVERAGKRCLTTKPGAESRYLYFLVGDPPAAPGKLWVVVRYFDDALAAAMTLEYDSSNGYALEDRFRPAEERAGGLATGAKRWREAIFELDLPRFAHRENVAADFRLSGIPLYVESVKLTSTVPAEWATLRSEIARDPKPLVKIGPGGELIVGGFDPSSAKTAAAQCRAFESAIPALKALGVTSHEVYVRWNLCELSEGHYDWSIYDAYVRLYKARGLKWVPFLIVGSPYSLPDWYYKKPGSLGYVCLEHHMMTDVQSLWNPTLRKHVERFIAAFCRHYGGTHTIESILLGITGNYGEAIYPVTGNDWTADVHGPYHTHPGYWCGDPFAVESFRLWLIRKYGGSGPLRDAWGEHAGDVNKVVPFLQKDAPNSRAWLDQCEWYCDSMTNWARFWLTTTRRCYPKGEIYLCTGGDAPPQHGSDFGAQCKAAAEVGAGVRITNEGSDYRANFSLTRWVASAGRQYGAYFSFEPAGPVDANGVINRIYGATASGARGLHFYYGNLFDTDKARLAFVDWGAVFKQRKPIVEIALYYPQTHIRLHGQDFLGYAQRLRDMFDFDYMSDGQIVDGGLRRIRALVLMKGNVSEPKVWNAITNWVRAGGLLIYPDGMGKLQTPEGDTSANDELLGEHANVGTGRVVTFHGSGGSSDYRTFVAKTLATSEQVSLGTREMVKSDGEEDGCFVIYCAPNELLWLNTTGSLVKKGTITLPPHSIASQKLGWNQSTKLLIKSDDLIHMP